MLGYLCRKLRRPKTKTKKKGKEKEWNQNQKRLKNCEILNALAVGANAIADKRAAYLAGSWTSSKPLPSAPLFQFRLGGPCSALMGLRGCQQHQHQQQQKTKSTSRLSSWLSGRADSQINEGGGDGAGTGIGEWRTAKNTVKEEGARRRRRSGAQSWKRWQDKKLILLYAL